MFGPVFFLQLVAFEDHQDVGGVGALFLVVSVASGLGRTLSRRSLRRDRFEPEPIGLEVGQALFDVTHQTPEPDVFLRGLLQSRLDVSPGRPGLNPPRRPLVEDFLSRIILARNHAE